MKVYMVWGKPHGSGVLVKLHAEKTRKHALGWIARNERYYDDMTIRLFESKFGC